MPLVTGIAAMNHDDAGFRLDTVRRRAVDDGHRRQLSKTGRPASRCLRLQSRILPCALMSPISEAACALNVRRNRAARSYLKGRCVRRSSTMIARTGAVPGVAVWSLAM